MNKSEAIERIDELEGLLESVHDQLNGEDPDLDSIQGEISECLGLEDEEENSAEE